MREIRTGPHDRQFAQLGTGTGGRVPVGQEIRMAALPAGLSCQPAGSLDDPDFNNVHVEVRWPEGQ